MSNMQLYICFPFVKLYNYSVLCLQVLLTVNDREFMGSQLLLVAGRRVAHYLLESHKMEGVELLTNVSPVLSKWLRSLVS